MVVQVRQPCQHRSQVVIRVHIIGPGRYHHAIQDSTATRALRDSAEQADLAPGCCRSPGDHPTGRQQLRQPLDVVLLQSLSHFRLGLLQDWALLNMPAGMTFAQW